MSKREEKKILTNLIDKKGVLYIYIYIYIYIFFFHDIKNGYYNLLSKKNQKNNVK